VVEDVELRIAQHVAERIRRGSERDLEQVTLGLVGNARKQARILDHDEAPRLLIDGAWRLQGGIDQLAQGRVVDGLGRVFAHRSAFVYGLQQLHGCHHDPAMEAAPR
jgi:hypothetical protein